MKRDFLQILSPSRVLGFAGAFVILVLVVPLFVLFSCLDMESLTQGLSDGQVWRSIWVTVLAGTISTVLGVLTGVPLAWWMSRMTPSRRAMVEPLTEIPIVLPPIIAGIALLQTISPAFFFGRFLKNSGVELFGTIPGIILAMYFVGVPFIVKTCLTSFLSIDRRYEYVARCLGASEWKVFFRIFLPLCWKGILNGCVLMFGRSMGIFGTVVLIASSEPTVPVLVYNRFNSMGLKAAITPALILTLVSLIFFVLRQFAANRISAGK
ncbi:MAG: hypothetical protein CVV64_07810 [Candidatus Wallbacteria bacterium HGW-Wallbacteria-1]|jgi:molybdate/tungstate transport system permease protein|uniref:ABC transmembrane type-1 domain-containing protein n=1 Tax=Candidatus Wallbacteria bacterium HGW-Wallbacteria-1 TaxID=2013854 RepID=A0A2N1PR15_9BACT|nr:MAG: hypothetical protein CVV64_07810 [Candidatus Wallbacteria bacterium HGW-Wallbacteria-1]